MSSRPGAEANWAHARPDPAVNWAGKRMPDNAQKADNAQLAETTELAVLPKTAPAQLDGGRGVGLVGQRWIRKQRTWLQMAGGLGLAVAVVGGAAWYVPQVVNADHKLLTGTVTSSAVVPLNFASSGEINKMKVHPGQKVRKGEVLADEYAPDVYPAISADKAAIAADETKIRDLQAVQGASSSAVSSAKAKLAADEAQLAKDQQTARTTQIIAPSAGVVVAANGQPGQQVGSDGIKGGTTDTQQAPANQSPQFSLLPEGPQANGNSSSSNASVPVIALRTSADWQVTALVPETSVRQIKSGQQVSVSVPAAGLSNLPGRIGEVLPTPESTSQGTSYQVVITVAKRASATPLNGMAADVQLGGS
ncbi:MAG: efflux RND transporter periplasmic adaptor subunit [Nocardiopsaceae bacterium]|nr:efflux RND transporter periplasmic adaptor subunit [Nocardiopsaceae bacterium]